MDPISSAAGITDVQDQTAALKEGLSFAAVSLFQSIIQDADKQRQELEADLETLDPSE